MCISHSAVLHMIQNLEEMKPYLLSLNPQCSLGNCVPPFFCQGNFGLQFCRSNRCQLQGRNQAASPRLLEGGAKEEGVRFQFRWRRFSLVPSPPIPFLLRRKLREHGCVLRARALGFNQGQSNSITRDPTRHWQVFSRANFF